MFRRGGHWAEKLLPPTSLTFDAYDTGARPRLASCDTSSQSGLRFQNLRFDSAEKYLFFVTGPASEIHLQDVTLSNGGEFNFLTQSQNDITDCSLTRVDSSRAGAVGIQLNKNKHRWKFIDCTSSNDGQTNGSGELRWGAGLKIVADRGPGNITDVVVDGMTVTKAGYKPDGTEANNVNKGFGIWIDLVVAEPGHEVVIRNSRAEGCRQAGLFCEKSEWTVWENLTSTGNATAGLLVGAPYDPDPPPTRHNMFLDVDASGNGQETIVNTSGDVVMAGGYSPTGVQLEDNLCRNVRGDGPREGHVEASQRRLVVNADVDQETLNEMSELMWNTVRAGVVDVTVMESSDTPADRITNAIREIVKHRYGDSYTAQVEVRRG